MTIGKQGIAALIGVAAALACRGPAAPRSDADGPGVLTEAATFERAAREGRMRFRDRDYRSAVTAYARALSANPGDLQILYALALASERGGDPAGAVAWLGRLADAGGDLVPFPDDFPALAGDAAYRAIEQRIAAAAARHRRAVEAFRIPEPGLLVEGIAYDPVEPAFYAGSGKRRKLIKIRPGQPAQDFTQPRPDIDAIGGVRVDAERRRLWAVSATDERMDGYVAGEPARNALVEIDLDTGALVAVHRLDAPGRHGLNDVAVDAGGRPYATDTADGNLYTLAADGQSLVAVFTAGPYFRPNGIAADDRGAVMFVADFTGVHRLDLATGATRRLAQPRGSSLGQLDGLYFVRTPRGPRLVGIQGAGRGRVLSAALDAGLGAVVDIEILESAHPLFDGPTTGAVVGASLYFVANSQLWAARAPSATIILQVPLEPRRGGDAEH